MRNAHEWNSLCKWIELKDWMKKTSSNDHVTQSQTDMYFDFICLLAINACILSIVDILRAQIELPIEPRLRLQYKIILFIEKEKEKNQFRITQ